MDSTIVKLLNNERLSFNETFKLFKSIIGGELDDAKIGAILAAMRVRGEDSEEIAGAAYALRKTAVRFPSNDFILTDTCGTGGDGFKTINISTAVALVSAECGVKVAKHGNRSVSSLSGSSDFLSRVGIATDLSPEQSLVCLDKENFCFLFAPQYHSGIKHAMNVRSSLKTRTLFNLIGPLANPALPQNQLMGVYDPRLTETLAESLKFLGCQNAMVVSGNGLDEIALHTETTASILKDEQITTITITPEKAGLKRRNICELQLKDPNKIVDAILAVFSGQGKPAHREVIALNTAAALLINNKVLSLAEGVEMALSAIQSGQVLARLSRIANYSIEMTPVNNLLEASL